MENVYMIDGIVVEDAVKTAKRIREICPAGSHVSIGERLQRILDEDATAQEELEAKVHRLKVIARNAILLLEEETLMSVMGSDLEDDLGITQEEYDEIVNDGKHYDE